MKNNAAMEDHWSNNPRFEEALAEQPAQQKPESFEEWNAKQHGDPEEIGFLQALRIAYIAGQDSVIRTSPPASKPWVWLTEEDIGAVCGFAEHTTASTRFTLTAISRAIEAKSKEKNNG